MSWSHLRRESIPQDARYLLRRNSSCCCGRNSSCSPSWLRLSSGVVMVLDLFGYDDELVD